MTQVATDHTTGHVHGDGHGHGHDHPPHLAHHFESSGQQFSSGKLGMWLFLATEVLLFGGLFCAYTIYRGNHPEIFEAGARHLDWRLGALNTVILILSSITMAWAVTASQLGQQFVLKLMLSLTLLGGLGFMVVKFFEYKAKIEKGQLWAGSYDPKTYPAAEDGSELALTEAASTPGGIVAPTWSGYETVSPEDRILSQIGRAAAGPSGLSSSAFDTTRLAEERDVIYEDPQLTKVYFSVYFGMTGLHGLHVLAGMAIITWLLIRSAKGHFGPQYFTPVDLGGLYWHLVDLIWIFLFPLLYLI